MLGLARLLKGTEWSEITEYLSPVFFQIVPPLGLASQVSQLTKSYLDKPRFNLVCSALSEALAGTGLPQPGVEQGVPVADARTRGEMVLELYFWQLLRSETVLLDLRSSAFKEDAGRLVWQPRPLYASYAPSFADAIRELYLGFYLDAGERFDAALEALNLTPARALFLQHFGQNQTSQTFALEAFRATFHQVFVTCKRERSRLAPDFLTLGASLFCLYEHLEQLGEAYDVRKAFYRAANLELHPG